MLALQIYIPEDDIQAKFPGVDTVLGDYGDAVPPFATIWGDFIEMITGRTIQGFNAEDVPSSTQKYAELFLLANALGSS